MLVLIVNQFGEVVDRQHFDKLKAFKMWVKEYKKDLQERGYRMEVFYD